jgi:dipeptidyl-peptidase-4
VGVVTSLLNSDARTDYARWIEALLGQPKNNPERYERASLLCYAGNLKGKLLLMHATSDRPCYLSHTFKVVDALIKNNKRFDLIIYPEESHGFSRNNPYMWNITNNYFIEHLKPDKGN